MWFYILHLASGHKANVLSLANTWSAVCSAVTTPLAIGWFLYAILLGRHTRDYVVTILAR